MITSLVPALLGMSLPAMIIANGFTYAFAILGILLAFSLPQVRDGVAIRETLSGIARSPIAWAVALLLLALYVGTLTGMRPEYSVKHWVRLVLMAVISGLLFHVFRTAKLESKVLTWLMYGVQATYIIAFAIAAVEPWALPMGYYGDKAWSETHLRMYSSVLAVVLPFCWLLWLKPAANGKIDLREKSQLAGMLWVCSSLILVLLCCGRSGWLGAIASSLVWLVMMSRYHKLRLPRFDFMALLAAGTLAISAVGYITLYGMRSIKERIGVTIPDRGLGGGRLDIWQLSYDHVFDHPFFGIGVNAFRFIPGADYHPHNFVLQIWLEGGLVSLLTAFVLLGIMFYALFKRGKTNVMAAAGLAALAGFVICALSNKSIFNIEWLVVLVVTMPLAFASRPTKTLVAEQIKKVEPTKTVNKAKAPVSKKGKK